MARKSKQKKHPKLSENVKLSKEWHPKKNGKLTPKDITQGSGKKVYWLCDEGHEWKANIANRCNAMRRKKGTGCPECFRIKFPTPKKGMSLYEINPELSKEWHPDKNGELTPQDIFSNCSKKVYWLCSENGDHEWQAQVSNRNHNKTTCPYCSNKKVCKDNCLKKLNPELSKEWHPYKNGELTPENVIYGSHKKVWWLCLKDSDHEWQAVVKDRGGKNSKCPYCAEKKAWEGNCLAIVHPILAEMWHPDKNGSLTPYNVLPQSDKKVYWLCSENSNHEWLTSPHSIVANGYHSKSKGCPFCSNKKTWGGNCLATIDPELSKEWHPDKNGELTAEDVTPRSSRKVYWLCSESGCDNEWEARVVTRTNGGGCPKCNASKTEKKVRNIIEILFKVKFPTRRPKWLTNPETGCALELDGYNENLKLAFEYDGEYHFIPHHKGDKNSLKFQQKRDRLKNRLCKKAGVTLIRIPYTQKNNLEPYIQEQLSQCGLLA